MTPTPRPVQRMLISLLAAGGLVAGGVLSAGPGGSGSAHLSTTYDAQARAARRGRAERRPHTHPGGRPEREPRSPPSATGTATSTTTRPPRTRSAAAARRRARPTAPRPPQRAASRARVAAQRTQREPRLTGVPLRSKRRSGARERVRHGRRLLPPRRAAAHLPGDRPRHLPPLRGRPHVPRRVRRRRRRLGGRARRPRRTGRRARRARPLHLHPRRRPRAPAVRTRASAPARRSPSRCAARRLHAVPRGRDQRAAAARSAASRRSRRSAATSTPTSTARPTSSSAAGSSAARRSTSTAPPPRSSTAPTTSSPTAAAPLLEDVLAGRTPGTGHDPVGWPTFSYWPNPHSLTHQQVYYKWLERSWRAGLRIHTSLLTENHILCTVYPLKKNSCDDRDAVRLQANGHAGDAGLHRRAVRRPRPRLVPHRHRPLRGPPGDQPGQARGGDGHGDVGARWAATSSSADPPAPRSRCSPSSPR